MVKIVIINYLEYYRRILILRSDLKIVRASSLQAHSFLWATQKPYLQSKLNPYFGKSSEATVIWIKRPVVRGNDCDSSSAEIYLSSMSFLD